jgi:hypothetical protein
MHTQTDMHAYLHTYGKQNGKINNLHGDTRPLGYTGKTGSCLPPAINCTHSDHRRCVLHQVGLCVCVSVCTLSARGNICWSHRRWSTTQAEVNLLDDRFKKKKNPVPSRQSAISNSGTSAQCLSRHSRTTGLYVI